MKLTRHQPAERIRPCRAIAGILLDANTRCLDTFSSNRQWQSLPNAKDNSCYYRRWILKRHSYLLIPIIYTSGILAGPMDDTLDNSSPKVPIKRQSPNASCTGLANVRKMLYGRIVVRPETSYD